MYSTILVPLDESAQAKRVLPYAVRLAMAGGGRLVLLEAIPDPTLSHHAEAALGQIAEKVERADCIVEARVRHGEPGPVIVQMANEVGADMIAMATDRWSDQDRWLNGSFVDWVLRHASLPIFVVPPNCACEWPADRLPGVLTLLDGSHLAEVALEPAVGLAQLVGSDLRVLRSIQDSETSVVTAGAYLTEIAARLATRGVRATTCVTTTDVVTAIATHETDPSPGIIVMATHARSGLRRLLLGSVATAVLLHATVPVVLVRPVVLPTEASNHVESRPEYVPFLVVG